MFRALFTLWAGVLPLTKLLQAFFCNYELVFFHMGLKDESHVTHMVFFSCMMKTNHRLMDLYHIMCILAYMKYLFIQIHHACTFKILPCCCLLFPL